MEYKLLVLYNDDTRNTVRGVSKHYLENGMFHFVKNGVISFVNPKDVKFFGKLSDWENKDYETHNEKELLKVTTPTPTVTIEESYWEYWGGWSGNHDRRIDDAKCNKCGYVTATVKGTPSNLPDYCPSCGLKMRKYNK